MIQDREFNPDGTFRYPVSEIAGATWVGEYFGDVMLVNGKVWPYLDVEPRMYRFRIVNGCNARILTLGIGGLTFWQVGAEGGLWDRPGADRSPRAGTRRARGRGRRLRRLCRCEAWSSRTSGRHEARLYSCTVARAGDADPGGNEA